MTSKTGVISPNYGLKIVSIELFESIKRYLEENGVEFRMAHHAPTRTSEESAAARGEDVSIGGKAIVMKIGERFMLFVLSAALKIDSAKIKERFQEKRTRFATAEELLQLTGAVPGAVPPFGEPIISLDLFIDNSIRANTRIAFNAGSLTDSIIMSVADYLKLVRPTFFDFSAR
jgi:prolyl-tRNA editing enzyme YbaK/EbsC (Cys-tRNA(Pro) deacylase)